jgi:hypothetical protein
MRHLIFIFIPAVILVSACGPAIPAATPQSFSVEYTAASIPWLADVTKCANGNIVDSQLIAADFQDPQTYDLTLRVGQLDPLISPAYQIGSEQILVIVNPENPVKVLSAAQVKGLFSGQILNWKDVGGSDSSVQVWTFPAGEDIQKIFQQFILGGSPIATTARMATSPEEMAKAIADDVNAVGLLNRRWKNSNVTDAFSSSAVPVLALTKSDPQVGILDIISCLQNKTQ